jgi:hypothetical protein
LWLDTIFFAFAQKITRHERISDVITLDAATARRMTITPSSFRA